MAQMVLLRRLAAKFSRLKWHGSAMRPLKIFEELNRPSELLTTVLQTQQERIRQLVHSYHHHRNWSFLGRGIYPPIAYESALKR